MLERFASIRVLRVPSFVFFCVVISFSGCKKPAAATDGGVEVKDFVALPGSMIDASGKINEAGMKQIEEQSKGSTFGINFVRCPLTDAGLDQLMQFKNLRRVNAIGSSITDAGVAKLKQAIPDVQVEK